MTELYSLRVGEWTFDQSVLIRLQNPGEPYDAVLSAWLIDHPDGVVLFDTGVDFALKQDPENYGPYGAPHMADYVPLLEMDAGDMVSAQTRELGYDPADVEYVVLSHLHMDHAGDITGFPSATFVVQQAELGYAFWPADPVQRSFYLLGDYGPLGTPEFDVQVVDGRVDLFGDGVIELIPTPGHTPGHQSLKIELDTAGTVILGADVANHMTGYENELLPPFVWDTEASISSIRKLKDIARRHDADVYLSHDVDRFEELPAPPDSLS